MGNAYLNGDIIQNLYKLFESYGIKIRKKKRTDFENAIASKVLNKLFWKIPLPDDMDKKQFAWFLISQLSDIGFQILFTESEDFKPNYKEKNNVKNR